MSVSNTVFIPETAILGQNVIIEDDVEIGNGVE
ncbi:MAG: hypothetical protein EOM65_13440, partial [Synergistales bacterium]|nr:hypothetical protein [Synergistales bacterium]